MSRKSNDTCKEKTGAGTMNNLNKKLIIRWVEMIRFHVKHGHPEEVNILCDKIKDKLNGNKRKNN